MQRTRLWMFPLNPFLPFESNSSWLNFPFQLASPTPLTSANFLPLRDWPLLSWKKTPSRTICRNKNPTQIRTYWRRWTRNSLPMLLRCCCVAFDRRNSIFPQEVDRLGTSYDAFNSSILFFIKNSWDSNRTNMQIDDERLESLMWSLGEGFLLEPALKSLARLHPRSAKMRKTTKNFSPRCSLFPSASVSTFSKREKVRFEHQKEQRVACVGVECTPQWKTFNYRSL